jgi:hypothetical protein
VADPYATLGLLRGVSLRQVRAAYKALAMDNHPDQGGSAEAFRAINEAYETILAELQSGAGAQTKSKTSDQEKKSPEDETAQRQKQDDAADIKDERERLRREAEARAKQARSQGAESGTTGRASGNARTIDGSFSDLIEKLLRSGLRGIATIVSALLGFGALLLEFNIVAILLLLGALIGVAVTQGFKLNRSGLVPIGAAVFIVALLFNSLTHQNVPPKNVQAPVVTEVSQPKVLQPASPKTISPAPSLPTPQKDTSSPVPSEIRLLRAAPESVLKIANGITYRILLRTGATTRLTASSGSVAIINNDGRRGYCSTTFNFPVASDKSPWSEMGPLVQACDGADVILLASISN